MGSPAKGGRRTCPRCDRTFESEAVFCPHDGAALEPPGDEDVPPSDRYIGTVIQGDIELRSVCGAGAMGRVYRAHQRGVDRDVAVKILHRELSGNAPLVQRFHREAKIASKLQHPHVVEVYLAGQLPDGALYIAMEFLDGMSLAAALQSSAGVMPLERALAIVLQICDAVGEGHARGIVHRDLKPENVMLIRRADTSDWVKVLDFGIAKVSLGDQSMQTAAGLIFGTARYISPEGAQGSTVGAPGDVYSIAIILYQLLSGHTPFDAEQAVGMLIKHIHDPPPALRSWPAAANVPEPIARVVMENLAKDPKLRAPSARSFGNAIAAAAKEANVSISDVGVVARMSALDLAVAKRVSTVEPTLDDRVEHTAPIVPAVSPIPYRAADALADTTADTSLPPVISARPAPRADVDQDSGRRPKRRNVSLLIMLAFMLGVAVTVLVMQHFAHRADGEHAAVISRVRYALARGNYVEPPNDNVRDIVQSGLRRWPEDPELLRLQSDAAHELVTRAMAARSGGDVMGARDLAKTAHDFDPTDGSARLLLAQYEDELAAVSGDAGPFGGPRVTLDLPIGRARPGGRAEFVGRLFMGPNRRDVTGPQFVVTGPGLASDGVTVRAVGSGPYRGTFAPPREGTYEVEFEANVDGTTVRAARTLNVSP